MNYWNRISTEQMKKRKIYFGRFLNIGCHGYMSVTLEFAKKIEESAFKAMFVVL